MEENGVEILEADKEAFQAKTQPVVDAFLSKASDGPESTVRAARCDPRKILIRAAGWNVVAVN